MLSSFVVHHRTVGDAGVVHRVGVEMGSLDEMGNCCGPDLEIWPFFCVQW